MKAGKGEFEEKKRRAKDVYIQSDLTLKELADLFGVSEKTMGDWAKVGKWKDEKDLLKASKQTAIRNLYAKLVTQTGDENTSSDEIKKTTSAIKDLEDSRTTIPDKIELYIDFIKFIRNQKESDVEFIKKVNRFQQQHIQEMLKNVTSK